MLKVPGVLIPICLRNHARGNRHLAAAVELLIAHGTWLECPDFVDNVLTRGTHLVDGHPVVWVDWDLIPAFLDDTAACISSEARVLCIAAELAGTNTGRSLADLLQDLDWRDTRLVVTAIAMHNGLTPHQLDPVA